MVTPGPHISITSPDMAIVRFVVIGGGPGGIAAATHAARLGAEVTLVERDVLGGAAHLWDCIPSKAMIATGGAISFLARSEGMGLQHVSPSIDTMNLSDRLAKIIGHLETSTSDLLDSQNVRIITGTGSLVDDHTVRITDQDGGTEDVEADVILLSTGSRPRIPDWCAPDGDRILTTRQAYPPPVIPEHLTVVGSGDVEVWANQTLSATVTGSGDVSYRGTPEVSVKVTGSGSVEAKGGEVF